MYTHVMVATDLAVLVGRAGEDNCSGRDLALIVAVAMVVPVAVLFVLAVIVTSLLVYFQRQKRRLQSFVFLNSAICGSGKQFTGILVAFQKGGDWPARPEHHAWCLFSHSLCVILSLVVGMSWLVALLALTACGVSLPAAFGANPNAVCWGRSTWASSSYPWSSRK